MVWLLVLATWDLAVAVGAVAVAVVAMRETCDFSLQDDGCRTYSIIHFCIALVSGLELPFLMALAVVGGQAYCCGKDPARHCET